MRVREGRIYAGSRAHAGMGTTAAWMDGAEWRAMRDHEFTYAVYRRDGRELLFHNRQDPFQMHDLSTDRSRQAMVRHYRQISGRWRKERNDTFEACIWYRDHWTKDRNIINTATCVSRDLNALSQTLEHWFPVAKEAKS